MPQEVHVNDTGTVIRITIVEDTWAVDISDATTQQIKMRPDSTGTTKTFTSTFTTDGTDGMIQYTLTSGDLDTEGVWQVQAYLETPGGNFHSEIDQVTVHPNL